MANIDQLNIIGDDIALEPPDYSGSKPRLEIQQQLIFQREDKQVTLQFSFHADQRGVAAFAHVQPGDVVGDLAVDEFRPVVSESADSPPKTEINGGSGLGKLEVLRFNRAILVHYLMPGEFAEPRSHGCVKVLERKGNHSWRMRGVR